MNILERKVENQVQFWSLIGPFLILLSVAILLFKVSSHWYIPLSALVGVPLCVKWKMKGMAAALSCLFLLSVLSYNYLEMDQRYWHVGMGLAMAFSLVVLTLSLEEVEGLVGQLQLESQSRLDNFTRLDEKWKGLEQEWLQEHDKVQTEVTVLSREIAKTQEDKQTFYKLAQLAKDELIQVRVQHEQLLQELFYKKQHIAQLQEQLEETEITVQGFVNSDSEKQIQHLTDNLAAVERERETLKAQVSHLQNHHHTYLQEKEALEQQLQQLQEQHSQQLCHLQQCQDEKAELQTNYEQVQGQLAFYEQETSTLQDQLSHLQLHYDTACLVEKEQEQLRKSIQQRLSELEPQAAQYEKDRLDWAKEKEEVEEQISHYQLLLKQSEENLQSHLKEWHMQSKRQEEQQTLYADQIQQQLKAKEQNLQTLLKCLTETQQSLQLKQQEEVEWASQREHLQQTLASQQARYVLLQEQSQLLQKTKEELEQRLEQLALDLAQVKQVEEQKEEPTKSEPVPVFLPSARRIEAMYKQLKEQFEEKSTTLDNTRRELFATQEQLTKVQREQAEDQLNGEAITGLQLQKFLKELNQEEDQLKHEYQTEVEELHHLIGQLFDQLRQKSKSG